MCLIMPDNSLWFAINYTDKSTYAPCLKLISGAVRFPAPYLTLHIYYTFLSSFFDHSNEAIQGLSATKRNCERGRALSKCLMTHQTQYLSVGYQMYPKLLPSSLLLCGRTLRKSMRSVSLHPVNKGRLRGNRTNEKPTLYALNGESVDNGLN